MAEKTGTGGGMMGWLEANPTLAIGGGVVLVLILAGKLMQPKSPAGSTPNADLSGLQNGNLVYVPTQTSFTTENIRQGAFSNDPNLITITNSGNAASTTTVNKDNDKTTVPPPKPPPGPRQPPPPIPKPPAPPPPGPRQPPPPPPKPPPTAKTLIWDQRYTILGGDTLSAIAARLTTRLRGQGMPGSTAITWHDLYARNTATINADAAAHHNPIPGGPWNDIFPGESITVPRWG